MSLSITLNEHEARILGVLIEKEMTTPDGYPLSMNATVTGCNQKSNRHPVTEYIEAEVFIGLTGLMDKSLASKLVPGGGGRVEKYKHTAARKLGLEPVELAVIAELMLRGPQTPGELRTRASRMSPNESLDRLSAVLDGLIDRGFVQRVPPAPGSRAGRFGQLLAADLHAFDAAPAPSEPASSPAAAAPAVASNQEPQVDTIALEARVAALEEQVEKLESRLDELTG